MIPHGPKALNGNRQIALPAELMARAGLAVGDHVYLAQHDDIPGALVVLPIEVVTTWIDIGRRADPTDEIDHGTLEGGPAAVEPG